MQEESKQLVIIMNVITYNKNKKFLCNWKKPKSMWHGSRGYERIGFIVDDVTNIPNRQTTSHFIMRKDRQRSKAKGRKTNFHEHHPPSFGSTRFWKRSKNKLATPEKKKKKTTYAKRPKSHSLTTFGKKNTTRKPGSTPKAALQDLLT